MRSSALILLLLVAPVAAAAPSETGQMIETASVKLYVEVRGAAPGAPLVVLNGGPGYDHTYTHIALPGTASAWDTLARKRRVVFYDQRGTGRSGPLPEGASCTLADQIADLDAVRAHLGSDRVDLVGHSYGGYLAMAYTALHPERVRRLVVVDSAAPKWSETVDLFEDIFPDVVERQSAFDFAGELGDTAAIMAGKRLYLSMLFYAPEKRDAWLAQVTKIGFTRSVNRALNADFGRFDLNPELRKLKLPALVLTGRYDANVAPSVAFKISRAIPGARLVVFEHSGHLPFFEEPEAFVKTVEEFLGTSR